MQCKGQKWVFRPKVDDLKYFTWKSFWIKCPENCFSHILGFLIQYLDHNSGLHMHNSGLHMHNSGLHMQRKIEISSIKVRKPQTGLLNGEYLRKEWICWYKSVKCNVKARNEYMQQKKLREKIPPFFWNVDILLYFFLNLLHFFFQNSGRK